MSDEIKDMIPDDVLVEAMQIEHETTIIVSTGAEWHDELMELVGSFLITKGLHVEGNAIGGMKVKK